MKSINPLTIRLLIFCISLAILTSCKDDSTSSDDITIEIVNGTFSFNEVNECDFDSGASGTEFLFLIEYEASDDIDISGVEFDLIWSDGEEDPNIFDDLFEATNQTLQFEWCFRFGTTEWFELDLKILAENREVESNEYTIRVDKPEDANKSASTGRYKLD